MCKSPLILAVFLCLLSLTANAQQKKASPSPTPKPLETADVVRVSTELVQTDVMVFGKDGRFVNGLKREQFELLIDGKPQPITFFESVVTGGQREEAALRAAGGKKPSAPVVDDSGESPSERARTIVFFINDLFLEPGSLARTHKTITKFINRMGPNDQVAITSASGQIGFLQQLTNNPTVLRAALDRLNFVPGMAFDGERPSMSPYAAYLITQQNDRPRGADPLGPPPPTLFEYFVQRTIKESHVTREVANLIVERRAGTILRQSDAAVKNALSSLANLLNSTAKLPGRKLVFFISDGFVPNFSGSDFTTMMQRATSSANRSGVVIYTLDSRGLSVDSSLDASNSGFDPTGIFQSRMSGERTFTQEPLHALAADTGGRAMLNSNDFDGAIQRALDETSRYYLLAWRPENEAQRAANFSKIKVNIVGQPELKVQIRRGYLGPPPEKHKPKAAQAPVSVETSTDDVVGVTDTSSEELQAALSLGYKATSTGTMQLTSAVQVSAQSPNESGGTIVANVLGAVFDSHGKAVGSFKQRIEVTRTRRQVAPVYTGVNHQVDVPPGLYQVRVIAAERGTTHLTGVMAWIEVPKVKVGTFSMSSLYVAEIPESGGAEQVGVNASQRFARSSRLRFTTYIYNAGTPPQLGAQLKILRGNQAVLTPPETTISTDKLTSFTSIPYAGQFPLSSLAPGNYVLDLTITDRTKKVTASQQLNFTIY
jgi:VWFA-related protein